MRSMAGSPPFRAEDPDLLAGAIMGMVLGAVHEAVEQSDKLDPEQWAAHMARFEARGLAAYLKPRMRD